MKLIIPKPNLFFLLLFISNPGFGDNVFDKLSSCYEDPSIEVRKSFSGTNQDASSPAQLTYNKYDSGDDFFNLDVAVKFPECSPIDNTNNTGNSVKYIFRFSPILEKHKSTYDVSRVDKESVALNSELDFVFPSNINVFTNLNYKLDRDKKNSKTTRSISFYTSLLIEHDYGFGRSTTVIDDYLELTYFPSIGYEKYLKLPIEQKIDGVQQVIAEAVDEDFWAARLQLEIFPFYTKLENKLVVNVGYTKRWLSGKSEVIDDETNFTEVAVTYYLDSEGQIGIGLNYSNGENPSRNFLDEEKSSIGINFKF